MFRHKKVVRIVIFEANSKFLFYRLVNFRDCTENETAILCALKIYKNYLPEDAIASVREKLSEVWTVKKFVITI
ncbi:unnamed protein product [Rhizophagus irregularis]|nr:unnamed protein product [Rhizophagus irregularis]